MDSDAEPAPQANRDNDEPSTVMKARDALNVGDGGNDGAAASEQPPAAEHDDRAKVLMVLY